MFSQNRFLHNAIVLKKAYDTMLDEIGTEYGMTRIEIEVLAFILNNPKYNTARDIVEYRMIAKSHVSKATDTLTEKGLLRGEQDDYDKRRIRLIPTEKSAEILSTIRTHQLYFASRLIEGMSAEEQTYVFRLTSQIADNAQKMLAEQTSSH